MSTLHFLFIHSTVCMILNMNRNILVGISVSILIIKAWWAVIRTPLVVLILVSPSSIRIILRTPFTIVWSIYGILITIWMPLVFLVVSVMSSVLTIISIPPLIDICVNLPIYHMILALIMIAVISPNVVVMILTIIMERWACLIQSWVYVEPAINKLCLSVWILLGTVSYISWFFLSVSGIVWILLSTV